MIYYLRISNLAEKINPSWPPLSKGREKLLILDYFPRNLVLM